MNRKLLIGVAFALVCLIAIFCRDSVLAMLSPQGSTASQFHDIQLMADANHVDPVVAHQTHKLLMHAAGRMKKLPALRANVRHRIDMFGQQMIGPGKYVQQGQGSNKARLDLTFQSGDFQANVLQINDGRYLYIRNDIAEDSLQRIDLAALSPTQPTDDATSATESSETYTSIGEPVLSQRATDSGNPSAPGPMQWMALGGLSHLLEQLAADFNFGAPRESTLGETPVLVIEGTWKPERVAAICGQLQILDKQGRLQSEWLPEQLPTHVKLSLAKDNPLQFFPHQVVYLRESKGDGDQKSYHEMATFEFYNVRPAKDLNLVEFQIERDDTRLTDITSNVIKTSEGITVR